jgi:hypothetical protein
MFLNDFINFFMYKEKYKNKYKNKSYLILLSHEFFNIQYIKLLVYKKIFIIY